jgi:hypothetical protein
VARDDNDIIDDKPMPLLEHLSELRPACCGPASASSSPS